MLFGIAPILCLLHCKMRSMKFIQNYHNEHTKIEFGMLIVVILYEFHTSHFAVYARFYATPQSIMLLIIHSFLQSSLVYEPPVTSTYSINSDLPHAGGIRAFNKIIIINFRGA